MDNPDTVMLPGFLDDLGITRKANIQLGAEVVLFAQVSTEHNADGAVHGWFEIGVLEKATSGEQRKRSIAVYESSTGNRVIETQGITEDDARFLGTPMQRDGEPVFAGKVLPEAIVAFIENKPVRQDNSDRVQEELNRLQKRHDQLEKKRMKAERGILQMSDDVLAVRPYRKPSDVVIVQPSEKKK